LIYALALVKKAAAATNVSLGRIKPVQADLITQAADDVLNGKLDGQFPLVVWQTGSGTQSNMNMNEVLANRANEIAGTGLAAYQPVHPNDHVNHAQSTNDAFPTAIHVAAAIEINRHLIPAVKTLRDTLDKKAQAFAPIVK
ncbi:lyase family protein, partial [Neisseria sp. P0001.S010]